MSEFKTLNVWGYSREGFNVLAKKYGIQNTVLFDHMVRYFMDQNISPMDRSEGIYKKMDQMEKNILKHVKGIIGFLRVQENDIILPVVHDSNRLVEQVGDLIEKHFDQNEGKKGKDLGGNLSLNKETGKIEKSKEENLREELEEKYRNQIHFLKEHLLEIINSLKLKNRLGGSRIELEGFSIQDIKRLKQACESI